MKRWVVVGIETGVAWPTNETKVTFKGYVIHLRPATATLARSIALAYENPATLEDALCLLREFLSSLSWVERTYVRETYSAGGTAPINIGKGPQADVVTNTFRLDYLPEAGNDRAQLALALYREALNLNSVPYQFLGFYKIINMLHSSGSDQVNWINRTLGLVIDYRAKERLAELQSEPNIGQYLYVSGRCAVAHAYSQPIINPDNPEHIRRLHKDLPLIRALAEYAIEHDIGIKKQSTIRREHLYQLAGFRDIFGEALVNRIKLTGTIDMASIPQLPNVSLRLRDCHAFACFEDLAATPVSCQDGTVVVRCVSADKRLECSLILDFAKENLIFVPLETVISDDGSSTAMRLAMDVYRFAKPWIANGEIEVWDTKRNTQLSRCDPFLPVNVRPDILDFFDAHIQACEKELVKREAPKEEDVSSGG